MAQSARQRHSAFIRFGQKRQVFFLRRLDGSVTCALAAPGIAAASALMAAGAFPYVTWISNTFILNSTTVA
ncbi:MAG TPA: hypothetical protein VFC44_01370, partial [Candidatus Saccharimonadales bacterium]|nr:hypothetical protein [Candidatus Saccharimonadales bacterium]